MKSSIILGLIQNIAILLAFSMLYDYIWMKYKKRDSVIYKLGTGLIIGFIGIILMLTPWILAPGLVFDTRTIMLSVSGLFFGTIPTLIAMLITGIYRITLGGDGVFMGVATIISSGAIGILWRKLRPGFKKENTLYEFLKLGISVHIVMLLCIFLLPGDKMWLIFKNIALPALTIYPIGTVLLGFLLINREENWKNKIDLKESEERFRNLFMSSHAIMLIIDPGTNKILDANPAATSFYGYSYQQFKNELYITDINTLSSVEIQKEMNLALENKRGYFIFKHRKSDGSIRNVEVYSGSTTIENKTVLFSIIHDITDRLKSEEKSANLNKIIQESLNEIYIFSRKNFRFIDVNEGAIKNIGYSLEELKEMTPLDIKPLYTLNQFKDLIEPVEKDLKPKIYFETTHRRKNNTEYPVEVYLQKVDYGETPAYLTIIMDVTERKKAEKALRDSEERLRLTISSSKQGIYDLNLLTGETIINDEYAVMLGYNPSELRETNQAWIERLHPEDLELTAQAFKNYVAGIISDYKIEFRQKTKQGKWKWILSTGRIVERDIDGNPTRMLGTHTDIDELKSVQFELRQHHENLEKIVQERTTMLNEQTLKLKESQDALLFLLEDINESRDEIQKVNEKLKEANKELEAFTYTVSHDLKAPLRAIDGFSRFLIEDYGDKLDAEGLRLLNVIRDNTRKMDQLIMDLLQLSKISRNDMHLNKINMNQFVHQIYNEISNPETIQKFKFTADNLPEVYGDIVLLKQVWINLISNAIKFTRNSDKCTIEVGAYLEDKSVVYYIRDSGVGFDTKYESKLFGVFQRLHKDSEFEGTGVGLAIVKRIITRHGGKVWAESELGAGSTFYLSLPDKDKE